MTQALINPEMLAWARQRAGLSPEALARKLGVKLQRVTDWEMAESLPTFRQAQQWAQQTHIPFGYLFLEQPPREELPIPDLRTVGDHGSQQASTALRDTINAAWRRQSWYRDYLIEQDAEPLTFVGSISLNNEPKAVAENMRERLGLPDVPRTGDGSSNMRDLVKRIEAIGVLVMRSSFVGNHTRRPLNPREFRGFALVDAYAPVIFVNTADAPGAQHFTLVHELAHIWLGQSGISDADAEAERQTERFCNAVAAEFLAPEEAFRPQWQLDIPWERNLAPLGERFHVSRWVIARRARTLGLISKPDYDGYIERRLAAHRLPKSEENSTTTGPTFYRLLPIRVSKRLSQAVAIESLSGRLSLREAHQLIGVKPHRMAEFAHKELGL
ncbi:XRE family transcriptional regulator [Lamprobacter modestohalophilus]|uniref:XRE family transcriptional regulator n=1 Tax=Lamprobacter modestohalophilus TaxID=1064514 RepID=UPI002ADEE9D4|nr:XRE family transcriptional regulator [Lamprobacter modestohalophilus]MEA1048989.1 XRE family transcriptional regulator [Lamprobacter modestohalophilus]